MIEEEFADGKADGGAEAADAFDIYTLPRDTLDHVYH